MGFNRPMISQKGRKKDPMILKVIHESVMIIDFMGYEISTV